MAEAEDEALRETAAHRGLKLVKSRRRKPGTGDYGHYGLTDSSGKELLGFGHDGLTATPAQIRDYLRKLDNLTWARSEEVTPYLPTSSKPKASVPAAADDNEAPADEGSVTRPVDNGKRSAKGKETGEEQPGNALTSTARREVARSPAFTQTPEPEPEPTLAIRAAAKADLNAIGALVGSSATPAELARRLGELRRRGGVLVADKGGVVGCAAWDAILRLQSSPIGRITLLVVAEDRRRDGIGRALMTAALAAMTERDCKTFEAMSDIEVRNANGFYRALGFQQKSYRFAREAEGD